MNNPDTAQTDTMTKLPYVHEGSIFADNIRTPCVDFDFDEVDRALGEHDETDRLAGADSFRLLTAWIASAPGSHAKFVRFLALASAIHPKEFPNLSRLAYESGCSRANLSRASRLASKHFGVRIPRSKAAPPDVRAAVAVRG